MIDRLQEITETLEVLKEAWLRHPDLRLGQLIDNALNSHHNNLSLFYISDVKMQHLLKDFSSHQ